MSNSCIFKISGIGHLFDVKQSGTVFDGSKNVPSPFSIINNFDTSDYFDTKANFNTHTHTHT